MNIEVAATVVCTIVTDPIGVGAAVTGAAMLFGALNCPQKIVCA